MASISTDSKGNRTIQFVGSDRKRRSIRLGKASLRVAESIKVRVESLNIANITGHPIDGETARWVAERDVMLLEKLAAVKLIQPREPVKRITLGEFLDGYQKRRDDVKDATKTVYRHTINNLLTEFGATRPLDSITPADADDFRRALQRRGDDSEAATPEAETLGIKLFDVATVLLNVSGRAARELKARWLKSPQLPKPIGQIYQSRRENLYSLDKIMAFVRQTEAELADGWDAIVQRLRLRLLKPTGKAKRGLSAVTVARRCDLAKQFFRDAARRKLIPENPFDDVGGGPKSNDENSHFIDQATIAKVIDACPNAEWRLLVALSRFGGLRIPSEALTLRWDDIDLPGGRMTVHAPKTEHHPGKATRVVPIFAELQPYLEDMHELAPDREKFVLPSLQSEAVQRGDWRAVNLRTRFEKIVKRAGLTLWPRLWHNLRASRQTELGENFPSHVVCAWLGNSVAIAAKHYLQVLDSHFAKAVRNPVQFTAALARTAPHDCTANAKTLGFPRVLAKKLGDTGFEPVTSTV